MKSKDFPKLFELTNRKIILTGSAGLLGTEYAHILSQAGADVLLVDINTKLNEKLKKTLEKKYGTHPHTYNIDITNEVEVKNFAKELVKDYGKIHGLINNAFYNHAVHQHKIGNVTLDNYPMDLWNAAVSINLTAVLLCCREIGKIMSKQKNGTIVNISSIYGMIGADQRIYGKTGINAPVSYAATKGGVLNLTRYLAAYWHKKNVRVNTLTLGGVEQYYHNKNFIKNYSAKTILGRMAQKDDYRGPILFLMSDASSYMTGSNLIVDGGWTAW